VASKIDDDELKALRKLGYEWMPMFRCAPKSMK
jgi:hypothetical protein